MVLRLETDSEGAIYSDGKGITQLIIDWHQANRSVLCHIDNSLPCIDEVLASNFLTY